MLDNAGDDVSLAVDGKSNTVQRGKFFGNLTVPTGIELDFGTNGFLTAQAANIFLGANSTIQAAGGVIDLGAFDVSTSVASMIGAMQANNIPVFFPAYDPKRGNVVVGAGATLNTAGSVVTATAGTVPGPAGDRRRCGETAGQHRRPQGGQCGRRIWRGARGHDRQVYLRRRRRRDAGSRTRVFRGERAGHPAGGRDAAPRRHAQGLRRRRPGRRFARAHGPGDQCHGAGECRRRCRRHFGQRAPWNSHPASSISGDSVRFR